MEYNNELFANCLKYFDINCQNLEEINLKNYDDFKLNFFKNDLDVVNVHLTDKDQLENNSIFVASKLINDELKFELILYEKNQFYIINNSKFKEYISYQELIVTYLESALLIRKTIFNDKKDITNPLKIYNVKLIIILTIFYLLVNFISVISNLFISIVTYTVINQSNINNLLWILLTFATLFIIKVLIMNLSNLLIKKYVKKNYFKLSSQFWEKVFKKPKCFFNEENNIFVYEEFIVNLVTYNITAIPNILVNVITTLCLSIYIIIINYIYFLVVAISILIILVISYFKQRINKKSFDQSLIFDNMEKNLLNSLYSFKNTYINNLFYKEQMSNFNSIIVNDYDYNLSLTLKNERLCLTEGFINKFCSILCVLILFYSNQNNFEQILSLLFVINLCGMLQSNVQEIYGFFINLPEIKSQNNIIVDVLVKLNDKNKGIPLSRINKLKLICPSFNTIKLEYEIEIDESVCIIGPSGIGKSHLLWGLCQQNILDFDIEINDINIKNLDSKTVENNIIYLRNDTPLIVSHFQQLMQDEKYTNEIANVLKIANLSITNILENNLSSGQKQLINILNLLLCENKLILLDEVASNIDFHIIDHLNEFIFPIIKNNNLVICVSHNPKIIEKYNNIFNLYEFIQENNHNVDDPS